MTKISATEAKNRFGELIEMSRKEPVEVQKNGRTVSVMISAEEYEAMRASSRPAVNPVIMKLHEESKKRWGKVYEALAK
jgi:prevent-host-death family protein